MRDGHEKLANVGECCSSLLMSLWVSVIAIAIR